MRWPVVVLPSVLVAAGAVMVRETPAEAKPAAATASLGAASKDKPWCAPEVTELGDHTCYFDGATKTDGRRTLVVYLHGSLATTPGFQWLQQRAMAIHAKRQHFTVLLPTSPLVDGGYVWPTGRAAQERHEGDVLRGLVQSKKKLERTLGVHFDETFIVGFSSGAYYGSSLAVRGALDVDGYVLLAGGSSWVRPPSDKSRRVPVFVGVSAADGQTADHSRALGATLAALAWPHRIEERNAGHMVDWTFMDHGIAWLRSRPRASRTN